MQYTKKAMDTLLGKSLRILSVPLRFKYWSSIKDGKGTQPFAGSGVGG